MKSILQHEKECYVCGTILNLHSHHIYPGANRKNSEKHGLKVWLCMEHHTGQTGVHFNKDLDTHLKQMAQRYFEENCGTHEEFIQIFGRNYL